MPGKKVMKHLFLVRHGRASQGDLGMSDKERPLETRGFTETRELTKKLVYEGVTPNAIIGSTAVRARQTAMEMAETFGFPPEKIQWENALYLGHEDNLLDILMGVSDDVDSVILVAHNPGITDLANLFLNPPMEAMPPSAIVALQFQLKHWHELPGNRAKTIRILTPNSLY